MPEHHSKKYWWAVGIVVPLAAAVIGILPHLLENDQQAPQPVIQNQRSAFQVGGERPKGDVSKPPKGLTHAEKEQEGDRSKREPTTGREYKPAVFVGHRLYGGSFRIEIISIDRIDEYKLKFGMLVRSLRKTFRMGLYQAEKTAYIVDPDGNRYFFMDQENLSGTMVFPDGIDIRCSITFLAPPATVKQISMVFYFDVGDVFPKEAIFSNLDLDAVKLITPLSVEK